MDRRGSFGVLAAVLLISVAVGVRDAAAVGRVRILMAEKDGERSKSGQEAGSQSNPASPVESSGSGPSSVPKNSPPPPDNPPNSPPPSRAAPNPPAASQKTPPLTPASGKSSNHQPPSGSSLVPVSGSPSHPPPAPAVPVNPSPSSSGNPSNRSPPPGSHLPTLPASGGRLNPPPASGSNPAPVEAKLPKPVPSEPGRETSMNGKDGKEKEHKKQSGSSSGPDNSQGKGQENDMCNASIDGCRVKGLVACLQQSQNESQKWSLLVQNEGENPLSVNISAPSSLKIVKTLPLPQHKKSKIELHADAAKGLRIVLDAGNGNCTLHMPPPSPFAGNFFQQLPNYANHVTPIYGIYLISLTIIFAGGTWACCKFRKRRRRVDAGVAYQQLEMGTQQHSSAPVDEDVIDGWDEGWNDDWDDEEAAPRHAEKRGSASVNGVILRSSDKNEWEDWDD